jgi:hypothetical protein
MTRWTSDELTRIGTADELEIAAARRDGTLGRPRTIWAVRVSDDLYVRSMYGRAGGVDKDVTFADADADLNDPIDAACRRSSYVWSSSAATAAA